MLIPKTMTLNLNEPDMLLIEECAKKQGITKTALARRAIKLYKRIVEIEDSGNRIFFADKDGNEIIMPPKKARA